MLKYQNLRFFNGDSGELDFYYDETNQYWSGNIYLPRVATGLYETCNLYIFEEIITNTGHVEYIRPISENAATTTLRFEFIDDETSSNGIFVYDMIKDAQGNYEISIPSFVDESMQASSINIGITNYTESNSSNGGITKSIDYKTVSGTYSKDAIHCNVAINSNSEDIHTRVLNIYEVQNGVQSAPVAAIKFYGETVTDDERLTVLLGNMGLSIPEEDSIIFNDTDVNELGVDWKIINNKKKELLLENSNIQPYIGTYKAVLNAIKFYGYNDITLKEYWLNINEQSPYFGKLLAVAVPNQTQEGFLIEKANKIDLPNSNHKKTNRFSLVYRLNEPTGNVDQWDIPTTVETSIFTPQEVLVKLYGLKNKLQKSYLPHHARIVDITGEADYFSQFKQSVWNNQQTIQVQSSGVEVSFEVSPQRPLFIEDLRFIDPSCTVTWVEANQSTAIASINSFYENYYNNKLSTFPTLSATPIGCPVILQNTSLPQSWDSCDFTWDDLGFSSNGYNSNQNSFMTWNNWWHKGVYEGEWVINGPNGYQFTKRDTIDNLYHLAVILPYTGSYDVMLNLYDLYNARSYSNIKSAITVQSKSVEIYGIFEAKQPLQTWNDYTIPFSLAGGTFNLAQESPTLMDNAIAAWYQSLDRNNYIHDESKGLEFSTVRRYFDPMSSTGFSETTGPYIWNYLKEHTWNEGSHINWDMTRVGSDLAASFVIDVRQDQGYVSGGTIAISWYNQSTGKTINESYTITSTYPTNYQDLAAWQNIVNELNALSPITNPILSKFVFNPAYYDSTGSGTDDQCRFIVAVGREYSSSYDFTTVDFSTPTGGSITGKINYTGYNPTYNDINILTSHQNLGLLTHLTFSWDHTKMPGVVSQRWTITNNSRNEGDIYYNNQWLTYLFPHRGDYTIGLELVDCNGNRNSTKKNLLTIT
jgi:hypothetical protein